MVQVPLDLADDSEPEPDFSFVPRFTPGEVEPHAAVVMELADSSLKLDLGPALRAQTPMTFRTSARRCCSSRCSTSRT
jgi:hypothetical protein